MRAGEASEGGELKREAGDSPGYLMACILVAAIVTGLFLWQPWNSNGSSSARPWAQPPSSAAAR